MNLDLNQPFFWLYLANLLLVTAAVLHMLYQRRSPQNLMAWLLTLILLPFFGLFLYLIFGSRKLLYKKNQKPNIDMPPAANSKPRDLLASQLDALLRANHIAGTTENNQLTLSTDGEDAYKRFMNALEKAQSSIYLETYIFELDPTGEAVLEALIRKAQQGVQVRLLMDAIGSFALYRNPRPLRRLTAAGGKFAFFQPVFRALFRSQVNLRNHRKIYLFDNQTLLTGGMNISDDYLGNGKHPTGERWHDLMLEITGPATQHYLTVFLADWDYATGERLIQSAKTHSEGDSGDIVQTVPSGPDLVSDALFEALLHSIHLARRQIRIVTPYFIPDSAVMNALLIAIKRGVKVTLITPESSDHLIFDLGRSSYMRELHEAGAELCYFSATMLHAKLVLIDDQVMLLGSANLDYRSLFINHEITNLLYSPSLIEQMKGWTDQLIKQSHPYQPTRTRIRRLLENLTRIVAPIL